MIRARAVSERTHDQEEIRRLTDKLYEENRVAIDKLRNAFDSIEHGDGGGGGGGGVNMTVTTSIATVDVTVVDCGGDLLIVVEVTVDYHHQHCYC
jgi:hypothetical protein